MRDTRGRDHPRDITNRLDSRLSILDLTTSVVISTSSKRNVECDNALRAVSQICGDKSHNGPTESQRPTY